MTVDAALRRAEQSLRDAGVPDPALDAEALLRHVLGWDRAAVIARGGDALPGPEEKRFWALVDERAARRPLPQVMATQAFWRHEFLVTPDVLVPRPETEILVEAALELMRGLDAPVVVDVGTGSGCVALSIAAERADAVVHAVDLSPAALAVARENARRLGLSRVEMHEGDLLEPVAHLGGHVDIIVSNPPYVDPGELPSLAPEVRDHEPRAALVAPGGPYEIYERLAAQSCRLLRPGGHLLAEVGYGMAPRVAQIFGAAGLAAVQARPDLAGIPRVVSGRRA
ncbi:MAG TPA: peptide chain release factor N(5)-glutamine methyltransferase [Vicinamibacteria bacterium]